MIQDNSELPARLTSLLATHTADWVETQQPVRWSPDAWQSHWHTHPQLPSGHVLGELKAEYEKHGTIRRKFIFDTYTGRPATELFIAVMAWGLGKDNRGPDKAGKILLQASTEKVIDTVVTATRQGGACAGYGTYYTSGNKLKHLDIAFVTKLLYFAGYKFQREQRPLIYDSLVSAAITRLPTAPLLPAIGDPGVKVTTVAYRRYCQWAEDTAAEHGTEPAVVEWALFALGAAIRETLRAERASQRAKTPRKKTDR